MNVGYDIDYIESMYIITIYKVILVIWADLADAHCCWLGWAGPEEYLQ